MDPLLDLVFKRAAAPSSQPVQGGSAAAPPSAPPVAQAPVGQPQGGSTLVLGGKPATPQIASSPSAGPVDYTGTPIVQSPSRASVVHGGMLLSEGEQQAQAAAEQQAAAEAEKATKGAKPAPSEPSHNNVVVESAVSGALGSILKQVKGAAATPYDASPSGGALPFLPAGPAGRWAPGGAYGQAGAQGPQTNFSLLPPHWAGASVINPLYNFVRPHLLGGLHNYKPENPYTRALLNTPGSIQGAAAQGVDPWLIQQRRGNPLLAAIAGSVGSALNQGWGAGDSASHIGSVMENIGSDLSSKLGYQ